MSLTGKLLFDGSSGKLIHNADSGKLAYCYQYRLEFWTSTRTFVSGVSKSWEIDGVDPVVDNWWSGYQPSGDILLSCDDPTVTISPTRISKDAFTPGNGYAAFNLTVTFPHPNDRKDVAISAVEEGDAGMCGTGTMRFEVVFPLNVSVSGYVNCNMGAGTQYEPIHTGVANFRYPSVMSMTSSLNMGFSIDGLCEMVVPDPTGDMTAEDIVINCILNAQYLTISKDSTGYMMRLHGIPGTRGDDHWVRLHCATLVGTYTFVDKHDIQYSDYGGAGVVTDSQITSATVSYP